MYKFNATGSSIRGGGALGKSTSPASHSGMDPDLLRGRSSQMDWEMKASQEQI